MGIYRFSSLVNTYTKNIFNSLPATFILFLQLSNDHIIKRGLYIWILSPTATSRSVYAIDDTV